MGELLRRLHYYLRRRRFEAELDEEMAFHRDLSGARRFGNAVRLKEESRAVWGWPTLDSMSRDLGYGLRRLARSPGFTVVAMLTLALGTGANTAVFQLLDAVRLRSLPVPAPQELAEIHIAGGNGGLGRNTGWNSLTYPVWEQLREHQAGFRSVFAWARTQMELGEAEVARVAQGAWVSGETFATLGIRPHRGRLLAPADDRPGCPAVAVISHGSWQREFGGLDSAVGSELLVRGRPVTVVGVTPPEFFGIEVGRPVEVYMPFCVISAWTPGILEARDLFWLGSMGRLEDGWTAQAAAARLDAESAAWFGAVVPSGYEPLWLERWGRFRLTADPRPNGISVLRAMYETSLWLLLGITALVLLIACVNLANLMLARSRARGPEIAVRMAIGASRARVLWQFFWESLLLALGGAALGVALATVLSRLILRFIRSQSAFADLDLPVDWRVLTFVAVSALVICLGLTLSTGMLVTRARGRERVTSGTRDGQPDRRLLAFQRPLVAAQVAISLVLVASSLLFVRSFQKLFALDAGFRQEGVVYHLLDFRSAAPEPERVRPLLRQALESVRSAPGVEAAATSTHVPLTGNMFWLAVRTDGGDAGSSFFTWVSPGYFETLEIPILAGRGFTPLDDAGSARVLLVNETFARRYFGGADAIGRVVRSLAEPDYPEVEFEVVGLVADTRYAALREDVPAIAFVPDAQISDPDRSPIIVTRSSLSTADVTAAVVEAVRGVHPEIRVDEALAIRQVAVERMARERMLAWLAGFFGVLALGLAAIGLYGVVSCLVEARRSEIGIRMALGATRSGMAWLVLRHVAVLLAVGLVIGGATTLGLARTARALLFEVEPTDPWMLLLSAALLAAVGLWAGLVPARRAARIDPNVVLHGD